MRVAETNDSGIFILITGAVSINVFVIGAIYSVRNCVGIGTQLNHAKGNTCPRESMPHFLSSDKRVDIIKSRFANAVLSMGNIG